MSTLENRSLLVVEDDPHLRETLVELLAREGAWVTQADDGVAACAVLATTRFDAVLLDLQLPEVSGFAVCRHLRQDPRTRDVPVLVVSGRSSVEDRARALEHGADGFLEKPFRAREVMGALQELLAGPGHQASVDLPIWQRQVAARIGSRVR